MQWTDQQRAELARQYTRVGYVSGELWPAAPENLQPDDILALFRRLPDGAGKAAYIAELAKARSEPRSTGAVATPTQREPVATPPNAVGVIGDTMDLPPARSPTPTATPAAIRTPTPSAPRTPTTAGARTPTPAALPATATSNVDSLRAAEATLRQAQLKGDVAALDRLLDDALVFTGPDGAVYGKAEDLDGHRSGWIKIAHLQPSEERMQVFGNIGVVSVRMDMAGTFKGAPFSGPMRYTRIWCEGADGWRIVAGHVSPIRS
jgi:ketosteroid isomerase-like protein